MGRAGGRKPKAPRKVVRRRPPARAPTKKTVSPEVVRELFHAQGLRAGRTAVRLYDRDLARLRVGAAHKAVVRVLSNRVDVEAAARGEAAQIQGDDASLVRDFVAAYWRGVEESVSAEHARITGPGYRLRSQTPLPVTARPTLLGALARGLRG